MAQREYLTIGNRTFSKLGKAWFMPSGKIISSLALLCDLESAYLQQFKSQ